jgi:hypothetical protein
MGVHFTQPIFSLHPFRYAIRGDVPWLLPRQSLGALKLEPLDRLGIFGGYSRIFYLLVPSFERFRGEG